MKQLTCEMCGSTDLLKENGVFVCQSCGCKYSVEEAKKMMIEGTVEVTGTVQVDRKSEIPSLLDKADALLEAKHYADATSIYEEIIKIDVSNYSAYCGMLLASLSLNNIKKLALVSDSSVTSQTNYTLLKKYATPEFVKNVDCYIFGHCGIDEALEIAEGELNRILANKFYKNQTNINISSKAKKITSRAFTDLVTLEKVVIPNSVKIIEGGAFTDCKNLLEINLPEGLNQIENFTFEGCSNLKRITIPPSVKTIETAAFENCKNLSEINLSEGLTEIGSSAFSGCINLESIVLPSTLSKIGFKAFYRCRKLSNIVKSGKKIEITKVASHKDLYEKYRYIKTFEISDPSIRLEGDVFTLTKFDSDFLKKEQEAQAALRSTPSTTTINTPPPKTSSGGCYVATCVYGSYDCPEVWTLRRFRDDTLGSTWYGRLFIRTYYTISPTLVKWFGKTNWFKKMWKGTLDHMIAKLQANGVEDTPYNDKKW